MPGLATHLVQELNDGTVCNHICFQLKYIVNKSNGKMCIRVATGAPGLYWIQVYRATTYRTLCSAYEVLAVQNRKVKIDLLTTSTSQTLRTILYLGSWLHKRPKR